MVQGVRQNLLPWLAVKAVLTALVFSGQVGVWTAFWLDTAVSLLVLAYSWWLASPLDGADHCPSWRSHREQPRRHHRAGAREPAGEDVLARRRLQVAVHDGADAELQGRVVSVGRDRHLDPGATRSGDSMRQPVAADVAQAGPPAPARREGGRRPGGAAGGGGARRSPDPFPSRQRARRVTVARR